MALSFAHLEEVYPILMQELGDYKLHVLLERLKTTEAFKNNRSFKVTIERIAKMKEERKRFRRPRMHVI